MSVAVLCIGGIDSSGGAGVLRDFATAAELGVPARVAVSAVTAQTDQVVTAVQMVAPEVLKAQIAAAFAQGPVGAVKLGMLGTAEIVHSVFAALPRAVPLVLDPVIAASSGRALLEPAGLSALLDLMPRVTVVTPNLPELSLLAGRLGVVVDQAAEALLERGVGAVLVKGGHATGAEAVDHLITAEGTLPFASPRLPGDRRGTGCSLATAIACGLARGQRLAEACTAAKAHVQHRFA